MSNRDTVLLQAKRTKGVSGRCIEKGARRTDPGHQWAEGSWAKRNIQQMRKG